MIYSRQTTLKLTYHNFKNFSSRHVSHVLVTGMNRFRFGLRRFATEIIDVASIPHRSISGLTVLVSITTVLVCRINVLVSIILAIATVITVLVSISAAFSSILAVFVTRMTGFHSV